MFEKMKIKGYLNLIFALLIGLSVLTVTFNNVGLHRVHEGMQDMVNKTISAQLAMETARSQINVAARCLGDMTVSSNAAQRDQLKEQVDASIQKATEMLDVLKNCNVAQQTDVAEYEKELAAWIGVVQKAQAKADTGELTQASSIALTEGVPAIERMDAAADTIHAQIMELREKQEKRVDTMAAFFENVANVAFFVMIVLGVVFAKKTTSNITKTTRKAQEAVLQLSQGNLSGRMDYAGKNEFGELADGINRSFEDISRYIQVIDEAMMEFANGNFTWNCPIEFIGDFAHIQETLEEFKSKMSDTLTQLKIASVEVGEGATQVSDAAQTLAQGATEQASSAQQLSAAIGDISDQITHTAEYAENADIMGRQAGEVVSSSLEEMKQMIEAIKDIAHKAENIQHIIKTIDDIAFQTNILALNAAVEAARAGTAGKGFAVVADEVRALAQKSSEAAKNTTALIESSIESVQKGTHMAEETDKVFANVAKYFDEILTMVGKIAQASREQAESVSQVTAGMEQIASVIQQNSATSEQSAAASEELNGQADTMKEQIAQFRLMQ